MRRSSLFLTAVAGLAFGLAGCGDVSSVSAPPTTPPPVLHSGLPSETLVQRMRVAPTAVAYSGVRRIEQSWQVGVTVYSTSYREEVASDGQGRVALQALELIAPTLPPRSEELWHMLQESRDGFLFRYRDFRIHDVVQMAVNYSPIATGVRTEVAGRDCDELVFALRHGAAFTYNLAVDRETGLVMRCEQFATDGRVMGKVEFESFELNPQFAPDFSWDESSNQEQPLPESRTSRFAAVGFRPRQPEGDGGRFQLLESTIVRSPQPDGAGEITWVKSTLTDGIEVVFVLHGGSDPSLVSEDVMRVAPSVGPWNHVEGTLDGERFMALGRASADELLDLIASTL
ncbi:MAG: hypothetical protein FJ298_01970 [Planctomycetes bacterium]|nr:hypothetical protein [Planctomycetota bacterium]